MTDFNLFFVFINQGVCHEMKRRKLHCYIDNSFTVLVDTYTQNDWTSSMLWLLIILVRGGYVFIILLLSYRGWEKWHRLLMHLIKTSSSWIDSWEVYKTIKIDVVARSFTASYWYHKDIVKTAIIQTLIDIRWIV